MKLKSFFIAGIITLLASGLPVAAQSQSYSGEWKLNREKSVFDPNQLYLSGITILLKADSLLTIRTYSSPDGQEYPFPENLSLDGKECRISVYDMPRITRATISPEKDSINIVSVTTFYGNNGEQNFNASETWRMENSGMALVLSFINSMAGNTNSGKHYFDRVK